MPFVQPFSWVRILQGIYRHDIAYVISSNHDTCDVLVVPRRRPYDVIDDEDILEVKEQKRSEKNLFNPEAAQNAGLAVKFMDGIHECAGQYFHCGLLRRSFAKSSIEAVEIPHPDRIAFFAEAQVDSVLVERTRVRFAAQCWKEGDLVRPLSGPFVGEQSVVVSCDSEQSLVTIRACDPEHRGLECETSLLSVRRVFRHGDSIKIFAGHHRGTTGTVIGATEDSATIVLKTMEVVSYVYYIFVAFLTVVKVSVPQLFLESHLAPHVLSTISQHPGLPADILHQHVQVFDQSCRAIWWKSSRASIEI
jgi:ribosomal protein L24